MHRTNRYPKSLWAAAVGLAAVSCGGEDGGAPAGDFGLTVADVREGPLPGGAGALDRAGAEARAVELLGGFVVDVDEGVERGLPVWEVEVRRDIGSLVEIELLVSTGDVVEIESESYVEGEDLEVQPGYIGLAEAVRLAKEVVPGTVDDWELELDGDRRWTWDIEIYTADGREIEVEIDARSGSRRVDDDGDDWDDRDDGYEDDDDDKDDRDDKSYEGGEGSKPDDKDGHGRERDGAGWEGDDDDDDDDDD